MALEALAAELANDPLARGYDTMTADEVVASLNTENRSVADTSQYTIREYFRRFGPDETLVSALQTAAPTSAAMLLDFGGDGGLDFSSAATQAAVAALEDAEVITADQATNCLALGTKTASRAVELGLGRVKPGHVMMARGEI